MQLIKSDKNTAIIWKNIGETPLEALERFRASEVASGRIELARAPMTYAGRLDPMAEGELLILVAKECKYKKKYLDFDKEYEVEIVFGIETDTYDALGLAIKVPNLSPIKQEVLPIDADTIDEDGILPDELDEFVGEIEKPAFDLQLFDMSKYVGKFSQSYPPYSSKTVDGKQLHNLARNNDLPEEMPTKDVEIYSVEFVQSSRLGAVELESVIRRKIDLVKGDFRQTVIKSRWNNVLGSSRREFDILKIKVKCSSGTYMRSLAHRIGKDMGTGAFALSIKRTKIFDKVISNSRRKSFWLPVRL